MDPSSALDPFNFNANPDPNPDPDLGHFFKNYFFAYFYSELDKPFRNDEIF